jgi:subtilase family serine protease
MHPVKTAALLAALGLLCSCASNGSALSVTPSDPQQQTTKPATFGVHHITVQEHTRRACPIESAGTIHCLALIRTDLVGEIAPVAGYGPSDLQSAYNLPSATNGTGQTIGIVDAFDDPNAEADLGVYRSYYGLPPCTTANGCFSKVNQDGIASNYPPPSTIWAPEISLDLDVVSAVCPNCNILLVEGNRQSTLDLGTAVDTAAQLGANVISNSYAGPANVGSEYYDHPGVIITAGAGDSGYNNQYPADFPTVVAVGGTVLRSAQGGRGWTETVWPWTGAGCTRLPKPDWQVDDNCRGRIGNDVAAVASADPGVAAYDSYDNSGWIVVGGTSVSTALISGVYGLAGNAASLDAAQSLYTNASSLNDITSGSDGTCKVFYYCNAGPGYDGPTGNGTPNGIGAF